MKYFGTDGIRQSADQFTPEFLVAIVRGLVDYAGDNLKVLIGGDTRESTEWILADLETILESFGLDYANVGVLPTPAIHYVFTKLGFDFAIDVTASHNPYSDNGLKIFEAAKSRSQQSPATSDLATNPENSTPNPENSNFDPNPPNPPDSSTRLPQKLSKEGCQAIEQSLSRGLKPTELNFAAKTSRADLHSEALDLYLDHLRQFTSDLDLTGLRLRLGLDCANGAMSVVGARLFSERGATVELINADSSYNQIINDHCGSTHLDSLKDLVKTEHLDYGIAFDGDGDRCLLVDDSGATIDGDHILAILADFFDLDSFATTVMANQGLLNWTKANHKTLEISDVGDSNVLSAMREKDLKLGGEQSGHIILPGQLTGDGYLTALVVARAIADSGLPLSRLAAKIEKLPQITINLPVSESQKQAFLSSPDPVKSLLSAYEAKLSDVSGRLLVRPSGTEPLIRITMWGPDAEQIKTWGEELAQKLGETLA